MTGTASVVTGVNAFGRVFGTGKPRPATALPRFGLAPNPETDTVDFGRHGNLLIPEGTPVFLLHGTFKDASESLVSMSDWMDNNLTAHHPAYLSYMPEIEDASGIRKSDSPDVDTACAMTLRDLGDFRYQVLRNNLPALKAIKDADDAAIGGYFNVAPELYPVIAPVIREHLLKPVFEAPAALRPFNIRWPLSCMVEDTVAKVLNEVEKTHPTAEECRREIFDTRFLRLKAREQGRFLNPRMGIHYKGGNVINLRAIDLEDIARLEGYLMFVEQELSQALETALGRQYPDLNQQRLAERARLTSAKLMDKLSPRCLAFGHSQGGVVMHAALMEYHRHAPTDYRRAFDLNRPGVEYLGGRSIGMGTYFSAPLNGVPDVPAFGTQIMDQFSRWHLGWVTNTVKNTVWRLFEKDRPGITEMRAGSPLINSLQNNLNLLDGKTTLISASDVSDIFVEPRASILRDTKGHTPPFAFNIELETEVAAPVKHNADEVIDTMKVVFGPSVLKALKKMPKRAKRELYEAYLQYFVPLQQHGVLLDVMDEVTRKIGEDLILDPKNQRRVLDTRNFEPFRYQSLIARGKSYRKRILSKPTAEAIALLQQFSRENPLFLHALIANANEAVPLSDSASAEARQILNETLDLVAAVMADPVLAKSYRKDIEQHLKIIADGRILPVGREETPSVRAQALLKMLKE